MTTGERVIKEHRAVRAGLVDGHDPSPEAVERVHKLFNPVFKKEQPFAVGNLLT